MSALPSLFDPPPRSVIEPGGSWLVELLTGSLVTALCIVAVAVLGLLMMTGRMQLRAGFQVVIGCFLLLGAASIASDLEALARGGEAAEPPVVTITPELDTKPEQPLPPANYDPYAGASVPSE